MALSDEFDRFGQTILEILFPALILGYRDGAQISSAQIGVEMSPDVVNLRAIRWAEQVLPDIVAKITSTTMEGFVSEFSDWHSKHEGIADLVQRLHKYYSPERAELIASTEVTRVYSGSTLDTWMNDPHVKGKKWYTNVDEKVCPVCGNLHGKEVDLDEEFESGIPYPPAHPRCRCQLMPVIPVDRRNLGSSLSLREPLSAYAQDNDYFALELSLSQWISKTLEIEVSPATAMQETVRSRLKRKIVEILSRDGSDPEIISYLMRQWAETSNDSAYLSMLMQKRAEKLFATSALSSWQKSRWNHVNRRYSFEWKYLQEKFMDRSVRQCLLALAKSDPSLEILSTEGFITVLGSKVDLQQTLGEIGVKKLRKIVDQTLEENIDYFLSQCQKNTQAMLKEFAPDGYLVLYRGVTLDKGAVNNRGPLKYRGNSLESWSIDKGISDGFGGIVLRAKVPVSRIISSCATGFGCLPEWEFVISGGNIEDVVFVREF